MTSFCRIYNKIMNRLKDKHSPVGSVNIIIGILQIIALFFTIIFIYIITPVRILKEYVQRQIDIPQLNFNDRLPFLGGMLSFGFILFMFIIFGFTVNHIYLWILLSIFIYVFSILTIACIVGLLTNSDMADLVFNTLLVHPLEYIMNKMTSHCDLQRK